MKLALRYLERYGILILVYNYLRENDCFLFQLNEAPSAARGTLGAETISKKNKEADDEIERMLAQLKS